MLLFSKSAEYALRAMSQVAEDGFDQPFNAAALCAETGIPLAFARKGFQQLVRAGILCATRGPGGGYRLKRPADAITLYDILVAIDGSEVFNTCPLGVETRCPPNRKKTTACAACNAERPVCGIESICPIHETWQTMRRLIVEKFANCTLHDIQLKWQQHKKTKSKNFRNRKKELHL